VAKETITTMRKEEVHIPRSDMRIFLRRQKQNKTKQNKNQQGKKGAGAQTQTNTDSHHAH